MYVLYNGNVHFSMRFFFAIAVGGFHDVILLVDGSSAVQHNAHLPCCPVFIIAVIMATATIIRIFIIMLFDNNLTTTVYIHARLHRLTVQLATIESVP